MTKRAEFCRRGQLSGWRWQQLFLVGDNQRTHTRAATPAARILTEPGGARTATNCGCGVRGPAVGPAVRIGPAWPASAARTQRRQPFSAFQQRGYHHLQFAGPP